MAKLSTFSFSTCSGALALALALSGCAGDVAVEIENTKAAKEVAQLSRPPGSVFTGWRVFQDRCASCHGQDATGAAGPNLLPIVAQMGPRKFLGLVLKRYDWDLPLIQARNSISTSIRHQ
jgi:cytochrome c553